MAVKKLGKVKLVSGEIIPKWGVDDPRFSKLGLYLPKEKLQGYMMEWYGSREIKLGVQNRLLRKVGEISKTNVVPLVMGAVYGRSQSQYCLYKETIYKFDRVGYSEEDTILQIMEFEDKERKKFERLRHKFSVAREEDDSGRRRERIPEEVRVAVWRRDGGQCARCGSRDRLEYDHIIPLSRGGTNTVRNIELLCESCNRQKGNNIG